MQSPPEISPALIQAPVVTAESYADITVEGIERIARLEIRLTWDWLSLVQRHGAPAPARQDAANDAKAQTEWPEMWQRGSKRAWDFNIGCLDIARMRQSELSRLAVEQAAAVRDIWLRTAVAARGDRRAQR